MANISDLTNTDWYIGVPFNTSSPRLGIGESSTRILGKRLLGIQVGNEPDLYASVRIFYPKFFAFLLTDPLARRPKCNVQRECLHCRNATNGRAHAG